MNREGFVSPGIQELKLCLQMIRSHLKDSKVGNNFYQLCLLGRSLCVEEVE